MAFSISGGAYNQMSFMNTFKKLHQKCSADSLLAGKPTHLSKVARQLIESLNALNRYIKSSVAILLYFQLSFIQYAQL